MNLLLLIVGLAIFTFGANLLIKGASAMALRLGLSEMEMLTRGESCPEEFELKIVSLHDRLLRKIDSSRNHQPMFFSSVFKNEFYE